MKKINIAVGILIPALDPDERLIKLIFHLTENLEQEKPIIIVDDGSSNQLIFNKLVALQNEQIHILHHKTNLGKGAALKTGFSYCLKHLPNLAGIATMDADGQHTVNSLNDCLSLFDRYPSDLILGTRTFSKDIPFRSRLGNTLTNKIVRSLTRLPITDTQTGLRVIPMKYVKDLVEFPGSRFEFEFDMLLRAKDFNIGIKEQPITTIYIDGNSSSHFHVIRDSVMIYSRFIKFSASGLISFFVDIILFGILVKIIGNHSLYGIMTATVTARLLSAVVNYLVNRHLVFNNAGRQTLVKYTTLLTVQMLASGYFTHLITYLLPDSQDVITPVVAKIICDFVLFLISYQLQKHIIFRDV